MVFVTRSERDEVMRYSGMLEGICMMLDSGPDEDGEIDEGTEMVKHRIMDISIDLESIAKGYDSWNGRKDWKGGDRVEPGGENGRG